MVTVAHFSPCPALCASRTGMIIVVGATSRRMSQSTAPGRRPCRPGRSRPRRCTSPCSWSAGPGVRGPASGRPILLEGPSIWPAGTDAWVGSGAGTVRGCLQVGQRLDRPANSGRTWNFMPQGQEKWIMGVAPGLMPRRYVARRWRRPFSPSFRRWGESGPKGTCESVSAPRRKSKDRSCPEGSPVRRNAGCSRGDPRLPCRGEVGRA